MSDGTTARILEQIYGPSRAAAVLPRLEELIVRYEDRIITEDDRYTFTEQDVILITYGDQIRDGDRPGLEVLADFLDRQVGPLLSTVHVLPFFPYSSDDGFSVIDYYAVADGLGDWPAVEALGNRYRLMFDLVLNHVSARSAWARGFEKGDAKYAEYFIAMQPDTDVSSVMRARSHPLLTPMDTARGRKWVWTTFSADQLDLNYDSPDVLLKMIDILLTYVEHGARLVRLDAIAYLWKRLGTSCVHLAETHAVVRLLRNVLDRVAPEVSIVTETNVPHAENISYFGDGAGEAQVVYQFSLAPLIAHALVRGNARYLRQWAAGAAVDRPGTMLNFTASHDGIGLRPLEGILPDDEKEALVAAASERGGLVSYRSQPDGRQSAYELNVNYLSLLQVPGEGENQGAKRFLLSQAIMLVMPGVPGIYFHSLVGSTNDREGVRQTGRARSINRARPDLGTLESELQHHGLRRMVFNTYKTMLEKRGTLPAFHPYADYSLPESGPEAFVVQRGEGHGTVWAVHNVTSRACSCRFKPTGGCHGKLHDVLSGRVFRVEPDSEGFVDIDLGPCEFAWLIRH